MTSHQIIGKMQPINSTKYIPLTSYYFSLAIKGHHISVWLWKMLSLFWHFHKCHFTLIQLHLECWVPLHSAIGGCMFWRLCCFLRSVIIYSTLANHLEVCWHNCAQSEICPFHEAESLFSVWPGLIKIIHLFMGLVDLKRNAWAITQT